MSSAPRYDRPADSGIRLHSLLQQYTARPSRQISSLLLSVLVYIMPELELILKISLAGHCQSYDGHRCMSFILG